MQRLVEKIWKEFAVRTGRIEVSALDGNGDSFLVFRGAAQELSSLHFANILRHPGCFYFFNISSLVVDESKGDEYVFRREICWLTDPLPPVGGHRAHDSVELTWDAVSFCGVQPLAVLDSVTYTLQVAEGIDYKEGYLNRFINDAGALDYQTVCSGNDILSTRVQGLYPAKWYHFRLIIDYLGNKVVSETLSINTKKWFPAAPGVPRLHVEPVRNAFDIKSDVPARLDAIISWPNTVPNGHKIIKYQVQIQRFDSTGRVIQSLESVRKEKMKKAMKMKEVNYEKAFVPSQSNQWIRSPGRSPKQIHNSLTIGASSHIGSRILHSSQSFQSTSVDYDAPLRGEGGDEVNDRAQRTMKSIENRQFKWEILYENLNRSIRILAPTEEEAEWHIRVRAKNSKGWSYFSNCLIVNHINFPSLFKSLPPNMARGSALNANEAGSRQSSPEANDPTAVANGSDYHHDPLQPEVINYNLRAADNKQYAVSDNAFHSNFEQRISTPSKNVGLRGSKGSVQSYSSSVIADAQGGRLSSQFNDLINTGEASAITRPPPPEHLHVLFFKENNSWSVKDDRTQVAKAAAAMAAIHGAGGASAPKISSPVGPGSSQGKRPAPDGKGNSPTNRSEQKTKSNRSLSPVGNRPNSSNLPSVRGFENGPRGTFHNKSLTREQQLLFSGAFGEKSQSDLRGTSLPVIQ